MAIQPVDLGAPVTGVGGDDYRQAHTKINANFVEVGADIAALKAKDVTQDTAVNLRATIASVDAKNLLQDNAISSRATIASVDAKNATQDAAITAADNIAKAAIPKAEKGAASGVATLGADGKVTPTQLPTITPVAWGNITGNIEAQADLIAKIPVITQAQGQSTTQAVSQKLFTDTVGDIGAALDAINGVVV